MNVRKSRVPSSGTIVDISARGARTGKVDDPCAVENGTHVLESALDPAVAIELDDEVCCLKNKTWSEQREARKQRDEAD